MPDQLHERRPDRLGDAMTWLCAGALAVSLVFVVGLLGILAWHGLGYFWQPRLALLELASGEKILGAVLERELIPGAEPGPDGSPPTRIRVKSGNRDLTGADFRWIDEKDVVARSEPRDAVLLERLEWGNFHGFVRGVRRGGETLASGADAWPALLRLVAEKARARDALERLDKDELGDVNYALERARLAERKLALDAPPEAERVARSAAIEAETKALHARYEQIAAQLAAARTALDAETVQLEAADGTKKEMPIGAVVRAVAPNALGLGARIGLYLSRVHELVTADPRESNTEGGIFPAIFGTVMMVFLMSLFVMPFGVIAAVYLREYAKGGLVVRLVRIAVNNLAGVPSIVFGVFGLGFFVYLIGGTIDQIFHPESLPTPTYGTGGILWASLTLALLTVPVVIVSAEEGLAAVPRNVREGSLALGATRFETLWRVVVPAAAPGILTGLILALSRAAGEVAPLMIVGMVKLAPSLPLDSRFPFVHLERKFMHLGFHIYDVGFQSPNVEAAKPLVFATALLLIAVVLVTNLLAILLRNHLRQKYAMRSI